MRNPDKYTKNIVILRNERFFMTDCMNRAIVFLLGLLIPIIVPAAGLPTLPAAPQIRTGCLDNGITYYVVTNSTEKGKADIALVQRTGTEDETEITRGSSAVNAMGALSRLPHFDAYSPYRFLSGNCIWPGSGGYVTTASDATVYKFSQMDLSRSAEMVDSSLLMVFDIIGEQAYSKGERYSPGNQAIVISGDIDANAVLSKMNMLSLLVPRSPVSRTSREYSWTPSDHARFRHIQTGNPHAVWITAEYSSPRTPAANMPTVQPLVSQKLAQEFGIVLKKRLVNAFRRASVPVFDIDFKYISSENGPGDEKFRITAGTSSDHIDETLSVLASVLAGMDETGTVAEEYRDAQNDLVMDLRRDYTGDVVDNSRYVDLCVSSFLYGSSLASSASRMDFFLKKNIEDEVGVRLFNNFVSAILDKSRNLTIECRADSSALAGRNLPEQFAEAWKPAPGNQYVISRSDTLRIRKNQKKVKLKTVSPEPLSGGSLWVFENGITVVYKNIPNTGTFRYCWMLKGGRSLVQGLKPGEDGYVSDLLSLYNVSGMQSGSFRDMLASNGISMECEVTMSDLRISGAAPSSRLNLLMNSLYSLSVDRTPDRKAYDYFRECEYARMAAGRSRSQIIDSLLTAGAPYSGYKGHIRLADDFQKRGEKFFENAFSRMNDGILLIVGDFDEYELKKELARELGGFRTDKVSSLRSRIQPRNLSGRTTMVVDGKIPAVAMAFSFPVTYTSSSYMATSIAALALEDRIASSLSSAGWYGRFRWEFESFPEERFNFFADAEMTDYRGIPATMAQAYSAEEIIRGVRKAVSSFAASGISSSELDIYKKALRKLMDSRMSDPGTIMAMLELRYSCGKDLVTQYGEKISSVDAASVNAILKGLCEGRRAEYGVRVQDPSVREVTPPKPQVEFESMTVVPGVDSLGLTQEAFRALGLDSTARSRFWLDSLSLQEFLSILPEAAVYVPAARPEIEIEVIKKAAADSAAVAAADSLKIIPADTVATAVADTLKSDIILDNQ